MSSLHRNINYYTGKVTTGVKRERKVWKLVSLNKKVIATFYSTILKKKITIIFQIVLFKRFVWKQSMEYIWKQASI